MCANDVAQRSSWADSGGEHFAWESANVSTDYRWRSAIAAEQTDWSTRCGDCLLISVALAIHSLVSRCKCYWA
eukprot:79236-Lingulodinium_polyedra.AAC.1